jgi:hypothetical protein
MIEVDREKPLEKPSWKTEEEEIEEYCTQICDARLSTYCLCCCFIHYYEDYEEEEEDDE